MSAADWKPSPPLARAVSAALLTFKRHHPRFFALVGDSTEAGQAFLFDYCRAFLGGGVSLEVIPDAAQRWVASKDDAPRAAAFAQWCRAIDREINPQITASYTPTPAPISASKNTTEIDKRSRYMLQEFEGKTMLVAMCWALLLEMAGTEQERELILYGVPPREDVDVAIRLIREGRRPNGGPLAPSLIRSVA